jgi:hypothetical protein
MPIKAMKKELEPKVDVKIKLAKSLSYLFIVLLIVFIFSIITICNLSKKNTQDDPKASKMQSAEVIGWGGKSVYLRDKQPVIDGFGYYLGQPLYLVPSGAKVIVKDSVTLINKEVWYLVDVNGKDLLALDNGKSLDSVKPAEGWMVGHTSSGESIKLIGDKTDTEKNQIDDSGWKDLVWKVFFLVFGSLVGLLVWKIISTRSFDETNWDENILVFEALVYSVSLALLVYVGITSVATGGDIPFDVNNTLQSEKSELVKIFYDFLKIFAGSRLGAALMGFLACMFFARVLSIEKTKT